MALPTAFWCGGDMGSIYRDHLLSKCYPSLPSLYCTVAY